MNKYCKLALITSFTLGLASAAQAQFFDKLKSKAESLTSSAKEVTKNANEKSEMVKGKPSLGDGPSDELVSFTNCAGLDIENVVIGSSGSYTFQQGFNKEKRTGFIDRDKGAVTRGCILPSIHANQIISMEVDSAKYKAMGSSNDWEMQCVRSADPSAGAVSENEPKGEYPYKVDYLAGKDYLLHCGHDVANANSCAEGSNSDRSGAHDKDLKARGKTMLSVLGNTSTLAPANGEKLYCQYYNKASRKSLFAFEYLRTRS